MFKQNVGKYWSSVYALIILSIAESALAVSVPATLPGAADSGRIRAQDRALPEIDPTQSNFTVPSSSAQADIPEGASNIQFILNNLHVAGVTVFSEEIIREIYAQYLGQEITLDIVYNIADQITEKYRNEGYFLSLAYVPEQNIEEGDVIIKAVEGYIGEVDFKDDLASHYIMESYIEDILSRRPIKAQDLESFLLRINSLPGYNFRAVLSAIEGSNDGAVRITLVPQEKTGSGYVNFDNYGSRFLGPNEISVAYTDSIIPFQQFSISTLTSLPTDELKFGIIGYDVVIMPDVTLQLSGGVTQAYPGYNLKQFEIDSRSKSFGAKLNFQMVKQREENFSVILGIDSRDTNTDVLDVAFTRDRVRAARASLVYDSTDNWRGLNSGTFTLSKGLNIFSASQPGELTLSRADAEPAFKKAELTIYRLQGIDENWTIFGSVTGQVASGPLFSSEEFGYGGQAFGRAYDSSEITGDHGLAVSVELRYEGLRNVNEDVSFIPYAFYDAGIVWNEDTGDTGPDKGSSAGLGFKSEISFGLSTNIGVAWPLTREAENPIYGAGRSSPRLLLQVTQRF